MISSDLIPLILWFERDSQQHLQVCLCIRLSYAQIPSLLYGGINACRLAFISLSALQQKPRASCKEKAH